MCQKQHNYSRLKRGNSDSFYLRVETIADVALIPQDGSPVTVPTKIDLTFVTLSATSVMYGVIFLGLFGAESQVAVFQLLCFTDVSGIVI